MDERSATGAPGGRFNPEEFAQRFTSCSRALWCIAAAMLGDRVLAEDVLQEAAVIALGKLHDFDPDTSFMAWMGQIVRYVALNQLRRRTQRRTVTIDPQSFDQAPAEARPTRLRLSGRGELEPGDESFDDRLLAGLDGLDETARACLLLRAVLDMPYREIALALRIPEGTAMSHVHRSRAALRDRLGTPQASEVGDR